MSRPRAKLPPMTFQRKGGSVERLGGFVKVPTKVHELCAGDADVFYLVSAIYRRANRNLPPRGGRPHEHPSVEWTWRSVAAMADDTQWSISKTERVLAKAVKLGVVGVVSGKEVGTSNITLVSATDLYEAHPPSELTDPPLDPPAVLTDHPPAKRTDHPPSELRDKRDTREREASSDLAREQLDSPSSVRLSEAEKEELTVTILDIFKSQPERIPDYALSEELVDLAIQVLVRTMERYIVPADIEGDEDLRDAFRRGGEQCGIAYFINSNEERARLLFEALIDIELDRRREERTAADDEQDAAWHEQPFVSAPGDPAGDAGTLLDVPSDADVLYATFRERYPRPWTDTKDPEVRRAFDKFSRKLDVLAALDAHLPYFRARIDKNNGDPEFVPLVWNWLTRKHMEVPFGQLSAHYSDVKVPQRERTMVFSEEAQRAAADRARRMAER